MLSVLSEANTDNTTNPDVSLSLWRERNSIISDTETEIEEEPGYITPEETSQTMETRLARVQFSPGSGLLVPNLNLNLMFGSAFART